MAPTNILRANFTISDAAKKGIEGLRAQYDDWSPDDPAAVLCVAWAIPVNGTGSAPGNVMLTFYPRSMLADVAHGIQEVSGVKLIFFTTEDYLSKFAGKILDYTDGGGFFLREPLSRQ